MGTSRPATAPDTASRFFTVQQANAMLPLLRAIVGDLVRLSQDVIERRQRLAGLLNRPQARGSDPYRDELAQMEEELEKDVGRLKEYADELRALGVEPKSAPDGLVDFPALRSGRKIWLCWKLGEPEVRFWPEWDAVFQGRQPLHDEPVEAS
jgi:hypothetical protein